MAFRPKMNDAMDEVVDLRPHTAQQADPARKPDMRVDFSTLGNSELASKLPGFLEEMARANRETQELMAADPKAARIEIDDDEEVDTQVIEMNLYSGVLESEEPKKEIVMPNGQPLAGNGAADGGSDAEPSAAPFPDRFESGLEQIDGLAHLDVLDGHVIVVAPEILDAFDRGPELLQVRVVATIGGLALLVLIRSVQMQCVRGYCTLHMHTDFQYTPIEPNVPVMLRRQRTHRLEEVALRVIPLCSWRAHAGIVTLRQAGEAAREETWS